MRISVSHVLVTKVTVISFSDEKDESKQPLLDLQLGRGPSSGLMKHKEKSAQGSQKDSLFL